jgi:hypothetical protein
MFVIADYAISTSADMEGIIIEKTYEPSHDRVLYYIPEKYVLAVELPSGDIEIFEVNKNTYYTIKRDVIFKFKTNIDGITDIMYGLNVK